MAEETKVKENRPRKIKMDRNSEVWVRKIEDEKQDSFGRRVISFHWEKLEAPINLGSIQNPNPDILPGFQVKDTSRKKRRGIFGMLDEED